MNLILTLLAFNILVSTGWAQKSRENFRTGLRQEAQRTSNIIEERSSPTKMVPEHKTTGQRRGDAAATSSPLVAGKGQCLVNGMIMYNGAAWSPQQCTICVCDQGKKVCEPLDCEEDITCPGGKLQIPPGECCPVCVKTVKPRDKAIKKGATQILSTMKPKMPNVETKNKQEDIKLLPSTPTMPSVPSFIRPTLPHIPSLPSGCLLSEFTIACANTKMSYLPLMTDPGLKTLYLAENEISKLPARAFAGLPNLEWLDLSKNKLDDSGLSNDVFKNLTKLKRLNLDGNRLTVLPLLPTSVQELKVNDNKLLELNRHSFRGLGNLLNLEMEGNEFHDGNVSPMTFKPLKKLIYLRLNRNHFRAIPSGLPTTIQELHLDNNRIEVVSEGILNKTLNLSVIVLSNNRLQEDRIAPRAWIHLMNVESLDLSHNRLVHVPSFLPRGAKQVILHHNQIELIPGYVFAHMKPGLEFLHLSHNHLRDDGVHAVSFFGLYKSLNELLLDNNNFQSIPRGILNLKSLQVLRLSFNKIRYVPLNSICDTRISQDSNLVSVHLENNYINRRLIPPTALSCIKTYYSVILRPQHEEYEDEEY
ncbi:extracellular matrix protein 2-like isoform X7 [Ranitomeya variabilis]|uniref:extracellular matrix protein 2-like isoform X7 n=1 Tax=Ranitomeya variabilis TaxID=490064 RepID=UPI0040575958